LKNQEILNGLNQNSDQIGKRSSHTRAFSSISGKTLDRRIDDGHSLLNLEDTSQDIEFKFGEQRISITPVLSQ
jgi:hypothetical protein